jgi:hypothetical protein
MHRFAMLGSTALAICSMSAAGTGFGGGGGYSDPEKWPAVFYGPDGQQEVYNGPLEVPEGWHDHPAKVGDAKAKTEIPGYEEAVAAQSDADEDEDQDTDATGSQTNGDGVNPNEPGVHNTGAKDLDINIVKTAEAKGYVLPEQKDITKDEIIKQLKARKVQFNASWNETRLYGLLKDNLDKIVDGGLKPVQEGNRT